MTEIVVLQHEDGALVVDSRLIASQLGIQHENFMDTLNKYKTQTEQAFGFLRFQTGEIQGRGQPEKYCFLTEDQAFFLMTLSRNTPEVVSAKLSLVKSFSEAKKLLRQKGMYLLPHTSIYIHRLENVRDHKIDDHLWMIFREASEILLMIEKDYRVPVEEMDLCDGSIGIHWSNYRKDKNWAEPNEERYIHRYRDQRGERECRAYHYCEKPYFNRWLREEYITRHLPSYLVNKYGKRAVRQIYEEIGKLDEDIMLLVDEKRLTPKQNELYDVFLAARSTLENRQYLTDF